MSVYERYGFTDRNEYLFQVAVDHNVPIEIVREIALLLGEEQDFEGLIHIVEEA